MKTSTQLAAALTLGTSLVVTPALADKAELTPSANAVDVTVGLGVGVAPDFVGSDDYEAIPLAYGKIQKGNYWLQLNGLEASANLIDDSRFNAGPVINYRFGRDDDVDNDVVSRLREVDDAVEIGAFASYTFPDVLTQGDKTTLKAQLQHDINDGHEGLIGDLSLSYGRPVTQKLFLTGAVNTTYGNDDYMESFFSVDSNNASRSGLREFEAEGGFQNVGVSLTANYALTDQWGLFGKVGYSQLVGDAKDSPIVEDQGDDGQTFAGLGLTYRF